MRFILKNLAAKLCSQVHAVTHVGDSTKQLYWYDANGKITKRIEENNEERLLSYDAENRLVTGL